MLDYRHRIAFDLALLSTAFLQIMLRFWVRSKHRLRNLQLTWVLSDAFVVLALMASGLATAFDVTILLQRAALANSAATTTLSKEEAAITYFKYSFYNQYAYITSLWSIKASFLCSYYTMSDHLSLKLRRALNGTWIALLLTWLGLVLDITFWCWPMERNWSLDESQFCTAQAKPAQAVLAYFLHMCTSIPVMSIPFFIIRKLNLGRGERYAIGFMFLLGLMTNVCSTISFALRLQFIRLQRDPNTSEQSLERKIEGIYLSACVEVWAAAVVVCLPSTRLAFRRIFRGRGEQNVLRPDCHGAIRLEPGHATASNRPSTFFSSSSDAELPYAISTADGARHDEDEESTGSDSSQGLLRRSLQPPVPPDRVYDGTPPPPPPQPCHLQHQAPSNFPNPRPAKSE